MPSTSHVSRTRKEGAQPSFDLVSRVATSPGASLDDVVARIGAAAVSEDLTTARDMLDRIVEARRAAPARIPRHERAHLFSDPYEGAPDPTKVSSDGEQLADAEPSDADPAAHRRHGGVGGARCSSRPVSADSWPVHREAADQAGVSLRTLHCVESGSANPMYLVIARCVEGNAQGTFFVCAVATVLTLLPKKLNGIVFSLFCLVGEKSSFRSIQERPCCAPRETR